MGDDENETVTSKVLSEDSSPQLQDTSSHSTSRRVRRSHVVARPAVILLINIIHRLIIDGRRVSEAGVHTNRHIFQDLRATHRPKSSSLTITATDGENPFYACDHGCNNITKIFVAPASMSLLICHVTRNGRVDSSTALEKCRRQLRTTLSVSSASCLLALCQG